MSLRRFVRFRLGVCCTAFVLLLPTLSFAQGNCTKIDSSTRPDCRRAIKFFLQLQDAIKRDDRKAVSSMISFPLLVTLDGRKARIRNTREFLRNYDKIMTTSVRCAIVRSNSSDVWGKYSGFTIGSGTLWWDGVIPKSETIDVRRADYWTRYPFKIITINKGYVSDHGCANP
jgi:hypothetical protein